MTELEVADLSFIDPLIIGDELNLFAFFAEDPDIYPNETLKIIVPSTGNNIKMKVKSIKRDPQNGATDIIGILKKINYPPLARAVLMAGADNGA